MSYKTIEKEFSSKKCEEIEKFEIALEYKRDWKELALESYAFVVGDQWEKEDIDKLTAEGKPALTLNKIQALIFLVSGIQRQNRTDFRAFPVGEEDSIKAEVITYLLKDMQRICDSDYKQSEQFEDGIICGEGWLEPWQNYEHDLIHGNLEFRRRSPLHIYPDPAAKEYDLSDARYICAHTPNIDKDELIKLFPHKKNEIEDLPLKKEFYDSDLSGGLKIRERLGGDYGDIDISGTSHVDDAEVLPYELVEYYFYKYEPKYLIVDSYTEDPTQKYSILDKKSDAEDIVTTKKSEYGAGADIEIIERVIKVPYIKSFVNGIEIMEFISPFYPEYKKIALFPFYAHWTQAPIEKKELQIQGIVQSLKDPQREINKRHSQALHHLNTATNSGWLSKKKGGFTDIEKVEKYGSTSGIVLEFDSEKPEQIQPQQLSTGHEALVAIANEDIKQISGINTELLAASDKSSTSGRAIHLRQQQGLMIIQRILDNFARTQREVGRFFISQIGLMYDVRKAQRAVGEAWLKSHFSKPVMQPRIDPHTQKVMIDPRTGNPQMIPATDDSGKMVTEYVEEEANAFFEMVLNDASLDRYDVVVGEVATSETIKLANYTMLLDFAKQGVPIPPDVLVDESLLTNVSKERIKTAIANMQSKQKA